MKILFAEDTADLNRVVSVMLSQAGYTVDSVADGAEAMDRLENDSYDVIILDIMMPKKNGMEVLYELRHRHILTPVIMLTAKVEVDDRVAGLDAGADDYLTKPFAMKELLARVRALIRRNEGYAVREIRFADFVLDTEEYALSCGNSVRLSIKEFELLQVLVANADKRLSTGYLLEHVWRNEREAQEDTVWLYISYLQAKLSAIGSYVKIHGERGGEYRLSAEKGEQEDL